MTALLCLHILLILFALRRGWRIAPFALMAVPRLVVELAGDRPPIELAGWIVPATTLIAFIALLSTASLVYTAIVDPEPA